MINTYRLGGKVIEIASVHTAVHTYCEAYRYGGSPDFAVQTTQPDIEFEREGSALEDLREGRAVRQFPDEYLEKLAVYRKIAEKMPEYDTFLFHGSAIAVDGRAYLFTAKSGTGKSTHARLWRKMLGSRAVMVNDDKPLIRIGINQAVVYGTPWNGKHCLSNNIAVPLKAVCVLQQAKDNTIFRVDKREVYPVLLQQMYRPLYQPTLAKSLKLLDRLCSLVSLYRMGCNMELKAAALSYETMRAR